MQTSLDVDGVVLHIKKIVEHVRCAICAGDGGGRVRYECGHAACERCSGATRHCSRCPRADAEAREDLGPSRPVSDPALSARVNNALSLLTAFQQTFCTDRETQQTRCASPASAAYRRRELSQRLETEKSLFPGCIQAPRKYRNRRTRTDLHDDTSLHRVREWLERSRRETEDAGRRRPLRDLDANLPTPGEERRGWLAASPAPVPFYRRSSLRGQACDRCARASAATASVGVQTQAREEAEVVVTVAEVHAPPRRVTRTGSSDKENRDPNAESSTLSAHKRKKSDKPSRLRRTLL